MTKRCVLSLWVILALTVVVGGSCAAPETAVEEYTETVPVEVEVPAESASEPVKLLVAIPQIELPERDLAVLGISNLDQLLLESLTKAADRTSEALGRRVEVSVETYALGMYGSGPVCMAPQTVPFDGYDVILLDSNSALPVFRNQVFASVPADLFGGYLSTVSPEVGNAFSDPGGELVGVVQSTNPIMIIYNPDRMEADVLEKLQATIEFDDLLGLTEKHPLMLPPYPAIVMLLLQSAVPNLTFEMILDPNLYDAIPPRFLDVADKLLAEQRVYVAERIEIAKWFHEGEIDWTIDDGTFLVALRQLEYEGPVAVASLPAGDAARGAGAMGMAWVVPATSQNQELAWALAARVVEEPGVSQWALANGMVPASQLGFEQGVTHGFTKQLLPLGLLAEDGELRALHDIAHSSKIWLMPAGLSGEEYQALYLTSNDLFVSLVRGDLPLDDTIGIWQGFLMSLRE